MEHNEKSTIAYLKTKSNPKTIIVSGLPGSGKSTFTKKLESAIGARNCFVIDKDTVNPIEPKLTELLTGDEFDRDSSIYAEKVLPHTIKLLCETARAAQTSGLTVIIDAPFLAEAENSLQQNTPLSDYIRNKYNLPIDYAVFISADDKVRHSNMKNRGRLVDQPKLDDWDNYVQKTATHLNYPDSLCDIRIHHGKTQSTYVINEDLVEAN